MLVQAKQSNARKAQADRLLILAGLYLSCWFAIEMESILRVEQTVINPLR